MSRDAPARDYLLDYRCPTPSQYWLPGQQAQDWGALPAINSRTLAAVLAHENSAARVRPLCRNCCRNVLSFTICSIALAICSTEVGSTSRAASPATSGIAVAFAVTTGVPQAIASNTGRPNPS